MNKLNKVLIGVGTIALIIIIGCILISPEIEPLRFAIHNGDINEHTVTVEILDSANESIFKETYKAETKKWIYSPEITKKKGEYTFKVTLDNKVEKTYKAKVDVGQLYVDIWLYDETIPESYPIYIVQAMA